jgi:hypothetical protein
MHCPWTHVGGGAPAGGGGHPMPHPPQFWMSFDVSAQ